VIDEHDLDVFSRLRQALADADEEETQFGFDVSKDDPAGGAEYQKVYDFAEAVFEGGVSLKLTADVTRMFREDIAPMLEGDGTLSSASKELYIRPLLELRLAQAAVTNSQFGMGRFVALLDYLVGAKLNERAQDYLASVARLYIWGFYGEVLVLARSTLEAALKDVDASNPQRKRRVPLEQRISAAGPSGAGRLDQPAFDNADLIRNSGNGAAHGELMCTEEEAFVIIQALVKVLDRLYPPTGDD
jgi:hypothetical protein